MTLADRIEAALREHGPLPVCVIATTVRKQKAEVISALNAHPERFVHNGREARASRWSVREDLCSVAWFGRPTTTKGRRRSSSSPARWADAGGGARAPCVHGHRSCSVTDRPLTTAEAPALVNLSAEKDPVELSRLRRRERPRPEHVDDLICELPLFWRKRGRIHVPVQTSTKVVVEPRRRVGELVGESVQLANLLEQGIELRVASRHDLRSVSRGTELDDRGDDAVKQVADSRIGRRDCAEEDHRQRPVRSPIAKGRALAAKHALQLCCGLHCPP